MSLQSMLRFTLALQRQVGDGDYSTVDGFAATPCAIWPASASTINSFSRLDSTATHEIATAVDLAAGTDCRLVIAGNFYLVIGSMPYQFDPNQQGVFITVVGRRNQP